MAEPVKPIPALFASIRGAPGEIECLNEQLAESHRVEEAFYEAALTILRAPEPWADKAAKTKFKRWSPLPTAVVSPWTARLAAYHFGGVDAGSTTLRFADFNRRLLSQDDATRLAVVAEVFSWGRVSPRTTWTLQMADDVIRAARDRSASMSKVPWSSSWTKIAAAATHDIDLDPEAAGLTQVIWDSRVSFAVAELLGASPSDVLTKRLLIVPGRTEGRGASGARANSLQARGWKAATGTWTARSNAFWRSQRDGSRLVQTMAKILNSHDEFVGEREGHGRWTSFDVALALFVEGY